MAKQETKSQKIFGMGIGAAAIILFVVWFVGQSKKTMRQAQETEILTHIAAVDTAERAYHAEYQKYSDDFRAIGYSPDGKLRGRIYLKIEEVPAQLQQRLSEDQKPFVSTNEYRILGVFKPNEKEDEVLFIKNNDQPIKKTAPYVRGIVH